MTASFSTRMQAALVMLLLAGSLATLGFNVFAAWAPRQREDDARRELRGVSAAMVEAAGTLNAAGRSANRENFDDQLTAITKRAIEAYPELEGGFYLVGADRFSGFFHGAGGPVPPHARRSEPPPLETPLIRVQAQQSDNLPAGQFLLTIRDVGPSRVAVVTEPVGADRPAALCTWVMIRLVDPKQLSDQVRRYQYSNGFALSGLFAAVALAVNLGRIARRQNQERERLTGELRRAEHLAILGTLLAGVAHEVRNPLAAIRSTVQLWQRLPSEQRSPNSLTAVVQAVDHINEIVSQLLTFSRVEPRSLQPLDVNGLLSETLDLVAAQAAAQNVTIERQFAVGLPLVDGAAQSLRQVFLNLVNNALRAMPNGGRLVCSSRLDAGELVIEIADTGSGVPAADGERIFDPFYTTSDEGTGLGLAISREIIEQHGGHIGLAPSTGRGATFRVRLKPSAHRPDQSRQPQIGAPHDQ